LTILKQMSNLDRVPCASPTALPSGGTQSVVHIDVQRHADFSPCGCGFAHAVANLARERLSIAIIGLAPTRQALQFALEHTTRRQALGAPLARLQAVRMVLGEMHTHIAVMQEYLDRCVAALNAGDLTPEEAAGAKYKATDLPLEVVDRSLQLFGGYGYMEEYPIARVWRDSRVQRIYGGTNEVMKDRDLVGRALVAKTIERQGDRSIDGL
jgi:acyl-CoA dehydrogenase